MKDLFIDNNVARCFANPIDPEYKRLLAWLRRYDETSPLDCAHLVVSNKLICEYMRTCQLSSSPTSIVAIVDMHTRQGRLQKRSSKDIKEFRRVHYKPHVEKSLRCKGDDRDHVATVLMSFRKMALVRDKGLRHDINSFPGFRAIAVPRPQDLDYD